MVKYDEFFYVYKKKGEHRLVNMIRLMVYVKVFEMEDLYIYTIIKYVFG
jgi:hypothetical protein